MLASTSVECLIHVLVCSQWVISSLFKQTLKVSYELIFAWTTRLNLHEASRFNVDVPNSLVSLFFFCPHRKSKDDTWVSNNTYWELRKDPDFSHIDFPTLWWPLSCWSHTFFKPAQPLMWSRLVLVTSVSQSYIHVPHWSSLLLFIKVNALIASAYISCVNMFMQTYPENVDTFWLFLPMFSPDMFHCQITQTEKRKTTCYKGWQVLVITRLH